jgi:hypothetical protein
MLLALRPGFASAQQVQTHSVTSELFVTATVENSCSVDSSAMALVSVTCSLDTPLVAASVGSTGRTGGTASNTPATTLASAAKTHSQYELRLCNFLASEQLENSSFNQFALNIDHRTAGPEKYYSTLQVCF